jgi:MFS family permease
MSETSTDQTRLRAWRLVAILLAFYILSFVDRQVLSLLVDPIKVDFGVSDTDMSLLLGFSFAVFYTLVGIPMGMLADRGDRRLLVMVGVFFWGLMTVACGLADSYWMLFLARVGVGIGEATLTPAAYSLIGEHTRPEQRGRAYSLYGAGIPLGTGLAFLLGGAVLHAVGSAERVSLPLGVDLATWQFIFIAVGAPGLVMWSLGLLIHEPRRLRATSPSTPEALQRPASSSGATTRALLQREGGRLYGLLFLGIASMGICLYALLSWLVTAKVRAGMFERAEFGLILGSMVVVLSTAGMVLAGMLSDRWRARHGRVDAAVRISALAAAWLLVAAPLAALAPTRSLTIAALVPLALVLFVHYGIAGTMQTDITPASQRGLVAGIYLFSVNLIGLGCGPTAVALVTDHVFGDPARVSESVAIVCAVACAAGLSCFVALLRIYSRNVIGR